MSTDMERAHARPSVYTPALRLDPASLKLKGLVDPKTAWRSLVIDGHALVHAMPTGTPHSFVMMGFIYEPGFAVLPLELITRDGRYPLKKLHGLRPCPGHPDQMEIVAHKPIRTIREAYDLARSWIDLVIVDKPDLLA